jgi:hypothetical protein
MSILNQYIHLTTYYFVISVYSSHFHLEQTSSSYVHSDGKPRDTVYTVSFRDSLETEFLLSWSCLGLEPQCLGLGTYCLGLVPLQDISRQLQLILLSRLKIIQFGRHPIRHNEFQWLVYLYETLALRHCSI